MHSLIQGYHVPQNREKGIDALCVAGNGLFGHAAGKSKYRFFIFFGNLGNTDGSFSHNRLTVKAAFPGDHDICIPDIFFQMGFFQNDLNTGFQCGIAEGKKSKPHTASSTGTGIFGIGMRKLFSGQSGIISQPFVHLQDHSGSSALLRSVDGGTSLLSAERVGDIAGYAESTFLEFGKHMIRSDGFQILQSFGSEADLISVFIQKAKAKCLQHSDTAVIGGTATDTDNKMPAAVLDCIFDDFAYTVSGGVQRILFLSADLGNPGGTGHFNDCGMGLVDDAVRTDNGVTGRTCDLHLCHTAVTAVYQSIDGALPAVRQRTDGNMCIFINTFDPRGGAQTCLHGGHTSFEGIDSYYYIHKVPFRCRRNSADNCRFRIDFRKMA